MNKIKKYGETIKNVFIKIFEVVMVYIVVSMMFNCFAYVMGFDIPITLCYKWVGIGFIGIGIVMSGLYLIIVTYVAILRLLKDKFGIWVRHRKKFIWIKSPIIITRVK